MINQPWDSNPSIAVFFAGSKTLGNSYEIDLGNSLKNFYSVWGALKTSKDSFFSLYTRFDKGSKETYARTIEWILVTVMNVDILNRSNSLSVSQTERI